MIGAIAGDIIGSPYEFNNIKTTDFPLFSAASRFTDDTVLTCALARGIMDAFDAAGTRYEDGAMVDRPSDDEFQACVAKALQRFGNAHPDAGYGGRFQQWLASERPRPYESWGNGSAMRVSSVGWFFNTMEDVLHYARLSAEVTHNHPEGVRGAQAIAAGIYLVRCDNDKKAIRRYVEREFGYDLSRSCSDIRPGYSFDVSCQGSVPEAFAAFLEGTSYEDVIRLAVSLGGDSDTIACMSGSLAEAYYGVPAFVVESATRLLTQDLREVLSRYGTRLQGLNAER